MSPGILNTAAASGLVLALCAGSAAAQSAGSTTVFAGTEFDNQDSRRFDLGFAARSAGGTAFDLVGARTQTDYDTGEFSSTYLFGRLTHDWGRFGLGGGVRRIDDDAIETLGWLGTAFYDWPTVRLTATVESRSTDFAETPFTATGSELGLTGVSTATGTSACGVDSLVYGLALNVTRENWSFYGSASTADYSSYKCDVEVVSTTSAGPGGPQAGPGRAPFGITRLPVVSRLVSGVTTGVAGYTATLLPREAALVSSSLMAGASVVAGARTIVGLELYHDTEEFSAVDTTTVLGFAAVSLTDVWGVEFTLGSRKADGFDNAAFAGIRLSAMLGR